VDKIKAPFRKVADVWVSTYFGEKATDYNKLLTDPKFANSRECPIAQSLRFFHWEFEYPEIWYKPSKVQHLRPGFSAITTNPPFKATKQIDPKERQYFWSTNHALLADELDYFELI